MNRSQFEIMAPVGSFEALHAAIEAGADAIYFGVQGLNMRNRSSANFTLTDLRNIIDTCNQAGVKTYLTVNTIIYDEDMPALLSTLTAAAEAGVSAVIASDIAAITAARDRGIEVHISTQCNISNTAAARYYSQWADTIVLARELNLDQVKAISTAIATEPILGPAGKPLKIEMFCHGALCMAVSGKCYLSLHELNSSANRGACAQICRRAYTVTDKDTGEQLEVENKYIMSPKDLKTIHFLNKMVDAGVTVFKIEGRARGPEYVYTAVKAYDTALRAICDGSFTPELLESLEADLAKIFNRGYWNGYYLGQRLGEWSAKYGSSATRVKKYTAKAVKYFSRLGVAEFLIEDGTLSVGDEIIIAGPTTGAIITTVSEIRLDLKPVQTATKGQHISIPVPAKVRPSDRLYLWLPTA
ncbi:MAG: U32 family peptidase [Barnesiella sp.]|nr:U32 family peptidase [Barnesiella sp.]